MTAATFENTLRSFVRKTPFQPFSIEMDGDETILVRNPSKLAFGAAGGASYLDDGEVHLIDCEQVVQIKPVGSEGRV